MNDLLYARLQMAMSLGFHIIFACFGMVMPFLMIVSHYFWLKKKERVYLDLTKAWSKGVAMIFATGAVSGTVLSFELGLLWPKFMEHAGPIIGMPFSLEGTAFFLEAIAIGFFLYGWDRVNPWTHWASGWVVGVSGIASGIFVVSANAWMNSPSGFDWVNGQAVNIDPVKALFNAAWFSQALHMVLAAFIATGFTVAGVHAYLLLRNPQNEIHKKAIPIALWLGAVAAVLQPLSGDYSSRDIARRQPLKLAAAEALFTTQRGAPLTVGGIPDMENFRNRFASEIPKGLSLLAFHDPNAEVQGLDAFPRENWPPVPVVHTAFQIMIAIGILLMLVSLNFFYLFFKKRERLFGKNFLRVLTWCTPLGFIAIEAGWTVTEVGRQPWIIYGIMRTRDSLTPMPGLIVPFLSMTCLYVFLSVVLVWLMVRQFKAVAFYEGRKTRGEGRDFDRQGNF